MTTATAEPAEKLYTTADLLAMPDDGIERWLIDGRIVEFGRGEGEGMTIRNKHHTRVEFRVSQALGNWIDAQPAPHGSVHAGEAGVRLGDDPARTVGIDVIYLSPEVAERNELDDESTIIIGVPVLAVEILSPHTTTEQRYLRTKTLRAAGVPLVWVIDPYERTVTVYRAGRTLVTLNETEVLTGDPELPGFAVPVARLFQR